MVIIPKVFTKEICQSYVNTIKKIYDERVSQNPDSWDQWESKTVFFDLNDEIVNVSKLIIERTLRIKLIPSSLEGQVWPEGGQVCMHRHDDDRSLLSTFNSMIYLNEDYEGGIFKIEYGAEVKPKIGTLTFFNGKDFYHGISPVFKGNRYSFIIWWSCESQIY